MGEWEYSAALNLESIATTLKGIEKSLNSIAVILEDRLK